MLHAFYVSSIQTNYNNLSLFQLCLLCDAAKHSAHRFNAVWTHSPYSDKSHAHLSICCARESGPPIRDFHSQSELVDFSLYCRDVLLAESDVRGHL